MDKTNPVLDMASLEAIAGLQGAGANDLLRNVIQVYLSHSLSLMQKLDDAVGSGDAKGIMQTAHTLKSSSAQLGALRLAELLRELEIMGKSEEIAGAPQLFLETKQEYEAARTALEQYLGSISA